MTVLDYECCRIRLKINKTNDHDYEQIAPAPLKRPWEPRGLRGSLWWRKTARSGTAVWH